MLPTALTCMGAIGAAWAMLGTTPPRGGGAVDILHQWWTVFIPVASCGHCDVVPLPTVIVHPTPTSPEPVVKEDRFAGCLIDVRVDYDRRTPIRSERIWYAQHCARLRVEADANADGVADSITKWLYDSEKRPVVKVSVTEDGARAVRWRYVYSLRAPTSIELDDNNDGVHEAAYLFAYADGNLVQEKYVEGSDVSWSIIYDYDDNNHLIASYEDVNGDGETDAQRELAWDAELLMTETIDFDADGNADSLWYYRYGAFHSLAAFEVDDRADGDIDSRVLYFYDSFGDVVESQSWEGASIHDTTVYAYDEMRRPTDVDHSPLIGPSEHWRYSVVGCRRDD